METREFLSAVVPAGLMVAARKVQRRRKKTGEVYTGFDHDLCSSHELLEGKVKEYAASHKDAYFALAAYKQGFHPNPKKPEKKQLRVHSNVAALKALWLDIDFKGGYRDAKEVVLALRSFCASSSMPPPAFLIGSGNGVHVYWTLDTPVTPERWQRLADALKSACTELDLKADPARTSDAASILRPPGTLNLKDPDHPLKVRILYGSKVAYTYEQLEAALVPWITSSRPKQAFHGNLGANADLVGGVEEKRSEPSSFGQIKARCAVLHDIVESNGADCNEPMWVATLQLLKHCEDGAEWVPPVSSTPTSTRHRPTRSGRPGPTRLALPCAAGLPPSVLTLVGNAPTMGTSSRRSSLAGGRSGTRLACPSGTGWPTRAGGSNG